MIVQSASFTGRRLAQRRLELGKYLLNRFAMMPLNDCFLLTFSLMA